MMNLDEFEEHVKDLYIEIFENQCINGSYESIKEFILSVSENTSSCC